MRGGGPSVAAQVAGFGLLLNGCAVVADGNGSASGLVGGTAEAVYRRPVVANGYYLVTSNMSPAADPVRWVVEVCSGLGAGSGNGSGNSGNCSDGPGGGSDDGRGVGWVQVGASGWNSARQQLFPQVAIDGGRGFCGLAGGSVDWWSSVAGGSRFH